MSTPDFIAWLDRFRAENPALARHLPPDLTPLPEVAARARAQAEHNLSAAAYMARVLPAQRIRGGQAAMTAHRALLDELEVLHGVPGEITVAIWGIESNFGATMGDIPVLEALATLAHDSPRAAYFEGELRAALSLGAAGATPARFTGSWAGASGHCQFMPSAIVAHATDHDKDGRADIWGADPTDALASIASYLAAHGWQAGQGWGMQVPPERPERLLIPAGLPGPAFATGPNFQVLLSYNRATLYALAVGLLADAIAGRAMPPAFPDRAPLARNELRDLQKVLTAQGYDTQGADGLHGPDTRAAICAFQLANGLAPDGFPSKDLLLHLGINTSGEREG
ncbi:MAG TPA: lytic murein transglycosylase [Aliiroseovarius sp.]|nr:lytic murein transglycosylase [Aliiroseovarius sp.]